MLRLPFIAALVLSVLLPSAARADDTIGDAGAEDEALPPYLEDKVAGGKHWRFETENGPVHVWKPEGYRHRYAGIVVYVHGFYTNVDHAWTVQKLAEQFRASRQNALFIVPEAPQHMHDSTRWKEIGHLIREARQKTKVKRPWGHIVVIGHSGAYRSITPWLDYPHLDHLILLDAMYGREAQFNRWLHRRRRANRMILVAAHTLRWAEPFVKRQRRAQTIDLMPEDYDDFHPEERKAKLLYIRSQYEHMDMVMDGRMIPLLLRLTRLQMVKHRHKYKYRRR